MTVNPRHYAGGLFYFADFSGIEMQQNACVLVAYMIQFSKRGLSRERIDRGATPERIYEMKLTKAQQYVVDRAKDDVDYARSHDFLHWVSLKLCGYDMETDWDAVPNPFLSNEYVLKTAKDLIAKDETGYACFEPHHWAKRYERAKDGECIAHANSKTLEALARMGMIEIIHDGRRGWDTIRLLNY